MPESVAAVLEARLHPGGRRAWGMSLTAAIVLHALVLAAVYLAPYLQASQPQPIEYVAVQIVPARTLGGPLPTVAPPREAKPQPPPPAPEPKSAETPVLPTPEKKRERKEERPEPPRPETRQPAAQPAAATETATSHEGGAGLTLGAAIAGLDNPSFTYGYYVDQMLSMIQGQWVRPPLGGGVEAQVYFRIQRDGRVTDLRIVRSSGYSSFDLAGLRAVQAASPLPPLPRGYTHGSLGVNLILH